MRYCRSKYYLVRYIIDFPFICKKNFDILSIIWCVIIWFYYHLYIIYLFFQPALPCAMEGCNPIRILSRLNPTSLRLNEDYIFYYVNIGQNVVTGLIPLVSLVTLNYLVYKHLKERRKGIFALGNILIHYLK